MTYVALVLWLEVGPLLMNVERVAVGTSLAANVANYGTLLVLESHVKPHVPFDLELFAAYLAGVLVIGCVFSLEMLLQPTFATTLEFAYVAGVILQLLIPLGVLPRNVGVESGPLGAFEVAIRTGEEQGMILGFLVLQGDVHFEGYRRLADLWACLALVFVSCGVVHPRVVPPQRILEIEIHVAYIAGIYRGTWRDLGFRVICVAFDFDLTIIARYVGIRVDPIAGGFIREESRAKGKNLLGRGAIAFPFVGVFQLINRNKSVIKGTFEIHYLPRLHYDRFLSINKSSTGA